MDTVNETKTRRRPRRSKADIEEAIFRAAVAQIKKKGFSMALVTDIVKRADIEPIVFYNRYKNLDEFYASFVKRYDFWMSDFVRDIAGSVMTESGYDVALSKLLDNLLDDSIVTELLRWEVAEGTPITERTSRLREIDCLSLIERNRGVIDKYNIDIVAISSLIVAGVYFMVLHKDRSTFGGIDLNCPEGRSRVTDAFGQLGKLIFRRTGGGDAFGERQPAAGACCTGGYDVAALAAAMRREGLSEDAVARCLSALAAPQRQAGEDAAPQVASE